MRGGIELVREPVPGDWWHDRLELARLIAWYEEAGSAPVDGFAYLIEKPWKYAGEYEQMLRDEEQERLLDEQESREDRFAL